VRVRKRQREIVNRGLNVYSYIAGVVLTTTTSISRFSVSKLLERFWNYWFLSRARCFLYSPCPARCHHTAFCDSNNGLRLRVWFLKILGIMCTWPTTAVLGDWRDYESQTYIGRYLFRMKIHYSAVHSISIRLIRPVHQIKLNYWPFGLAACDFIAQMCSTQ